MGEGALVKTHNANTLVESRLRARQEPHQSVGLTAVSLSDPPMAPITCPSGNPLPSLSAGASETCTGSYAISQADINAGRKDNAATADSDQTTPVNDFESVLIPAPPLVCGVTLGLELQTIVADQAFQASVSITAGNGFVVESPANVSFDAPGIMLTSGFSVKQGASFSGTNQGLCAAPPP